MSVGELAMTLRIWLVAVCCSRASVATRCKSAYDGAGGASVWGRWRGVPHSPQNFIVGRFSCWHRGHVMQGLPAAGAAKGRNRGPRLPARDSHGQEHGHTGYAARGSHNRASPVAALNQRLPLYLGTVALLSGVRSLPPLLDSRPFERSPEGDDERLQRDRTATPSIRT